MTKTAFISGVEGFVGSAMAAKLDAQGYEVTGCDIKSGLDCREVFKTDDNSYDVFVHAAAVVGGRAKIEGQPLDLAVDLSIDAEAVNWMMRTRPAKSVLFSSSAAYPTKFQTGMWEGTALDEDRIAQGGNPDSIYGWVKLTLELLAQHVRDAGLDCLVVRPFSGYGIRQDETYPFRAFIERAKRQDNPFQIWGDGTQVRDFIHIDDVCNAIVAMWDQDVQGPINLCTGVPTSFNDLAVKVCLAAGYMPEFERIEDAPRGVDYRLGSPEMMSKFYTPKITLEQGIIDALAGKR